MNLCLRNNIFYQVFNDMLYNLKKKSTLETNFLTIHIYKLKKIVRVTSHIRGKIHLNSHN